MTALSQTTPGGGGFAPGAAAESVGQAAYVVRLALELFSRLYRSGTHAAEELPPALAGEDKRRSDP
jgi:hypothetical protein